MKRCVVVLCVGFVLAGCSKPGANTFRITATPPSSGAGFWSALYQTTAAPVVDGNTLQLVDDGAVFDAIVADISAAQHSVNIVVFIWRPGDPSDRILQALTERARQGVACRVLVDPVGSTNFEDEVKPQLDASGCQVLFFRPIPADENLARNHRKIVVVDGKVGITGGFGIHKSWLGDGLSSPENWRDTNVRAEGPVVSQMQQAFAENWQEASGEVLPVSDFPYLETPTAAQPRAVGARAAFVASTASPEITRAERLTQLVVQSAHRRLWIAQAYFTPNDVLKEQLIARARAGVEVKVLAPGDHNDQPPIKVAQRATYDELIAAGVEIYEYQPSMMHAKTMLVDEALVVIGSINYDPLSFNKLEEGSLVVESPELFRAQEQAFLEDLKHAKRIERE